MDGRGSAVFPANAPEREGCRVPFRPETYFLGLQPGWLHAQGFLPSVQEVEQYFFPFTSTVASLQEQAPLLHPAFASFSIAAISTSMRRSVSRIYPHGACHHAYDDGTGDGGDGDGGCRRALRRDDLTAS